MACGIARISLNLGPLVDTELNLWSFYMNLNSLKLRYGCSRRFRLSSESLTGKFKFWAARYRGIIDAQASCMMMRLSRFSRSDQVIQVELEVL